MKHFVIGGLVLTEDILSVVGGRMVDCPVCTVGTDKWGQKCPACGFIVGQLEGFKAWAPESAKSAGAGEFYKPGFFKELAALEETNFWFQARNELILWTLAHYCFKPCRFAEIGCGTGFVLSAVERAFPEAELVGTELFIEGLKFASQRCTRAELVQLDARRLPYREHFDVVGIFDVLEHIEDDRAVLEQIAKSLLPGGALLISVPQHQFLWSPVDEDACHVRRYSAKDMENKVISAGFEILRSTSFVSLLLPAMLFARLASRKPVTDATAELHINKHLNRLFRIIMKIEFALIRGGVNFPFGGSRLLLAKKKSK